MPYNKKITAAEQQILSFYNAIYNFFISYKKSPTSNESSTAIVVALVNGVSSSLITDLGLAKANIILTAFSEWKKVYGTNATLTADDVVQLAAWVNKYISRLQSQIKKASEKNTRR